MPRAVACLLAETVCHIFTYRAKIRFVRGLGTSTRDEDRFCQSHVRKMTRREPKREEKEVKKRTFRTSTTTRRIVVSQRGSRSSSSSTSSNRRNTSNDDDDDDLLKTVLQWLPVRIAVLEMPLLGLFLLFLVLHSSILIHERYIHPYMVSLRWTDHRKQTERTYPSFHCNASAVTATIPDSLFLFNRTVANGTTTTSIVSPKVAVDSILLHGAGVFPSVLDRDDAADLRAYVLAKAQQREGLEQFRVLAKSRRTSFGLTGTEHPSIPRVLRGIATNRLLKRTMEELLGPNPAMIALSVIVAHPGADDQVWHLDKMHAGSSVQYAASFIPNYALLIPLQDTTPDMGATAVCPGTHRCNSVAYGLEQEHGFRVQPTRGGVWQAGDGLLYHAQVRHRGSANTIGPDRAVLILTFASKPDASRPSAHYTRLLPLGSIFALRWDMWGFCWSDLADATHRMQSPLWRSLGLWKPADADWGWDYFRTLCHLVMNDGHLQTWIDALENAGHAWWINLLSVQWDQNEDDAAYEWLFVGLAKRLRWVVGVGGVGLLVASMAVQKHIGQINPTPFLLRIGLGCLVLATVCHVLLGRMATNPFWDDVAHNRTRSRPAFVSNNNNSSWVDQENQWVHPDFGDVLVSSLLEKEETPLGGQGRQLEFHAGNQRWWSVVRANTGLYESYGALPEIFRTALTRTIVEQTGRKFLQQAVPGGWIEMSTAAASVLERTEEMLRQEILKTNRNGPCGWLHDATRICQPHPSLHGFFNLSTTTTPTTTTTTTTPTTTTTTTTTTRKTISGLSLGVVAKL